MAEKYNRLTIIGEPFFKKTKSGSNLTWVNAVCECGGSGQYSFYKLKSGQTKSCGCLKRAGNNKKHGLCGHKLYYLIDLIGDRCYNKNHPSYKHYGGRGISVCEEWRGSHKSFYDWAISSGWKEGLQIDRIDNNGNYEPSNCRFVDRKTNIRNRRNTRFQMHQIDTMRNLYKIGAFDMTELGLIYGVHKSHVRQIVREIIWT